MLRNVFWHLLSCHFYTLFKTYKVPHHTEQSPNSLALKKMDWLCWSHVRKLFSTHCHTPAQMQVSLHRKMPTAQCLNSLPFAASLQLSNIHTSIFWTQSKPGLVMIDPCCGGCCPVFYDTVNRNSMSYKIPVNSFIWHPPKPRPFIQRNLKTPLKDD